MQKLRILAAAMILGLSFLGSSASTSAHNSGYCGHGRSGYWNVTWYAYSYNTPEHMHVYDHYTVNDNTGYGWVHNAVTYCPEGNGGGSW